ncbi:MAG: hypothetical protein ACYDHP_08355 [Ferrimicrobium sp.]
MAIIYAKNAALEQLSSVSQRQLLEALADCQCPLDDHPIWATVAILGAVIAKAGEGNDMHASIAATAQLNRQMPGFLTRLEEALGSTQKTLATIEARLARLEARAER